ncbi:MAG: NADH:flavin oxidoreductase [Myxococcota bacterium]
MTLSPHDALPLSRGPAPRNRLWLAPLTNTQSYADGTISADELRFLTLRARGGFGVVMTCAMHVQANGQGFPGQLGIYADAHVPGLTRLAKAIHEHGGVAYAQLFHGGMRANAELTGEALVSATAQQRKGARALTRVEVEALRDAFIAAALRAERAGFDGVELHGAHGYVLAQFLSPTINTRDDDYGGDLAGRARLLREVLEGVRAACRPDFTVGVRLSGERFGITLAEMRALCAELLADARLDYLDLSLWDSFKEPAEEEHQGRSLMSYFTDLERGDVRLGVAGQIMSGADVRRALGAGADFVCLGRAAILHHDFPRRLEADRDFAARALPVSAATLREEGLGDAFVSYMGGWKGFVEEGG